MTGNTTQNKPRKNPPTVLETEEESNRNFTGAFMAIGAGIGLAIGVALGGPIGICLAIGAGIGLVIGSGKTRKWRLNRRKRQEPKAAMPADGS